MTLLPEVRQTLLDAVQAQAGGHVRSRWRRAGGRSGGLALLGLAVATSALAATGLWSPQLGDERRGTPSVAGGRLPSAQLATLAVLRRPQTAMDRGPQARAALKLLVAREDGGIRLDGVRLLSRHAGGAMVLIPQQRFGSHDPGFASSIRRDVLVLHYSQRLPRLLAIVRLPDGRRRQVEHPAGMVTALTSGTADQLARRGIVNVARVGAQWRVYGLVPDQVVAVRLEDSATGASAVVHDNSFDMPAGRDKPTGPVAWLDGQGRVIGAS